MSTGSRHAVESRTVGPGWTNPTPESMIVFGRTRPVRNRLVSWDPRNTEAGMGRNPRPTLKGEWPWTSCRNCERKKNEPYMPAYTNPRARLALLRVALDRSLNGSIGSDARRSSHTKAPSSATPATREPTVKGSAQPELPASTRPSTIKVIPAVEVTAPAISKRPWRRSVSTSTARPTSHTAIPMGTFTNMTQRHDAHWVSSPPATSPMAPPAADTVVKRPIARTRWAPSGNNVVSRANEEGAAKAAPTP